MYALLVFIQFSEAKTSNAPKQHGNDYVQMLIKFYYIADEPPELTYKCDNKTNRNMLWQYGTKLHKLYIENLIYITRNAEYKTELHYTTMSKHSVSRMPLYSIQNSPRYYNKD